MRVPLTVAVVASLVAASCSGSDPVDSVASDESPTTDATDAVTDGSEPASPADGLLDWGPCESTNALVETECATLMVPLDHADPDGAQIDIAVARVDSAGGDDQIGSLVFNPGGPGGSGIEFLAQAAVLMPAEVTERFDLVGFDPRGVGESTAVACDVTIDDNIALIDDGDDEAYAELVDDTLAELATCTEQTIDLAPYLGTNNAARDLDVLRAALGDDGLTYVGYSYGTRLGATYAELFPDNVRALVLDAGVKPTTDQGELDLGQADGFDRALQNFAAACDADVDCVLTELGPTLDVLEQLRTEIADVGSFPTDDPDRTLTPGELEIGVIASLYSKTSWPFLALALYTADVDQDGTLLQVLGDSLLGRQPDGTYDNSQIANGFINCADDAARPGIDEIRTDAELSAARSEYFEDALRATTGCFGYPDSADPLTIGPAEGAPPILVIGNTGDPATPYEWSVELADSLSSGVLFTVDAEGHTAYGSIDCVAADVNAYLIDLVVPAEGASCSDNEDADFFLPAGDSEVDLIIALFDCLRENGADVPEISVADVLADPTGEIIGEGLDPTDPAFATAVAGCTDILLELQGTL